MSATRTWPGTPAARTPRPPQPEVQALTLVRALLNCTQRRLAASDAPWSSPIAGGRRVIRLHPTQADGQLTI